MLQLGHETACVGNVVSVNWLRGGAHPRAYDSSELSPELCAPGVSAAALRGGGAAAHC